nr:serine/threonine-protein kinase GRIK2 [Ipomoea batatas]
MFTKKQPVVKVAEMGCCGCFGFSFLFSRKPKNGSRSSRGLGLSTHPSQEPLLDEDVEEDVEENDVGSYDGTDTGNGDDGEYRSPVRRSEDILISRAENGFSCREFPVKETHRLVRSEDENGSKMVNEYVHKYKIGSGSYGKVVS